MGGIPDGTASRRSRLSRDRRRREFGSVADEL